MRQSHLKSIILLLSFVSIFARADIAEFEIKGMTCSGCVKLITSKVCKLDGVASCDVKIGKAILTSRDGSKIDTKKIEDAINGLGEYHVTKTTVSEGKK